MNTPERRVLEMALLGLETERERIETEMVDIRKRLGGAAPQATRTARPGAAKTAGPNKGKTMSAAQKRAISRTMRELWAKRRKAAKSG